MIAAAHSERAEAEALAAVTDALTTVLGAVLDEHIEEVAPLVLDELRKRLGGYLIDPQLAGMSYVNALPGTLASREIYLFLENTREDNMRLQTHDGARWTTIGDAAVEQRSEWRVVHERGLVHVARVAVADGTVLEYVSGPSGPTRFGTELRAREAARALNLRQSL